MQQYLSMGLELTATRSGKQAPNAYCVFNLICNFNHMALLGTDSFGEDPCPDGAV